MSHRSFTLARHLLALSVIALLWGCQAPTTPAAAPASATPQASPTTAQRTVLTFAYEDRPNPPFALGVSELDLAEPGITLEILKLIADQSNIEIKYVRMPWARCLEELQANRIDGVFHASFKTERLEIGAYPMKDGAVDPDKRIMTNAYYLYTLKNSIVKWDGEKFTNMNGQIGAIRGYSIIEDLTKLNVDVYELSDQTSGLRMLVKERLDGVANLGTMTDQYLTANATEFSDIVRLEPPLNSKDYYLLLSHQLVKDHPELADAIWGGFQQARESGKFDEIAKKYAK